MGLFDKKYCDICGEKIGLLGNRKLEDGNLCKHCARKLSPWFSDRRRSTVAEIREQLAYRMENQIAVADFRIARTLGNGKKKLLLDEDAKKFTVANPHDMEEANPDILDYSQVTGSHLDIDEDRHELTRTDKDGHAVSYSPPRYEYRYDFNVVINVNHPYFDQMDFRINDDTLEITSTAGLLGMVSADPRSNAEYRRYAQLGQEIVSLLNRMQTSLREEAAAAAAPKKSVVCKFCGATTVPDACGNCEYCGSPIA